jgi:hypothetical protein
MNTNRLRKQGIGMLVALTVEYLLGIAVNLYITFPNTKNQMLLWQFASKQVPLAMHMLVGILMVVGSLVLVILSLKLKDRSWVVCSVIGFIAIVLAALTGSQFIPTQENGYSFAMAACFIIAFLAYAVGVYKTKRL